MNLGEGISGKTPSIVATADPGAFVRLYLATENENFGPTDNSGYLTLYFKFRGVNPSTVSLYETSNMTFIKLILFHNFRKITVIIDGIKLDSRKFTISAGNEINKLCGATSYLKSVPLSIVSNF